MSNAGRWWPRVSAAGVLAVLAVAVFAGLRPAPGVAVALRGSAPVSAPVPAATTPGALLAPVAAARTIASRGEVAYALNGTALTLEDIPVRALAAYQRAATVIDEADDQCHLDWQLLAALGKVLSDHGRLTGAQLDDEGVPRPHLVGQRLTGRHGTQRIPDSDAGEVDGDGHVDRAVGPMMLLPAVWSVVSVDGDSDGRRNPQDVDDATLASAVFLCAGRGDLRNPAHRREEVRRFHSGSDYVRSVLGVRNAYLDAEALTTVSVLAREQGVAPLLLPVGSPTPAPGDQVFSAGSQFDPAPSVAAVPTPTATAHPTVAPSSTPGPTAGPSPSGDPTPSATPSPSGDPSPSGSPSPTTGPSGCASASDTPEPTAAPTECPSPTAGPSPTGPVRATEGGTPAAGLAVPLLPLLPVTAVLWRRRRRTAGDGAPPAV